MKKFIKENWFKIVISFVLLIALMIYSIPKFQDYLVSRKCRDIEYLIRLLAKGDKESEAEYYNCSLKYPNLRDEYNRMLGKFQDIQKGDNFIEEEINNSVQQIDTQTQEQNNIYRKECKNEIDEKFTTVDNLVQSVNNITKEQAQNIARNAGITDEDNYVIDKDILIKRCIDRKINIYNE